MRLNTRLLLAAAAMALALVPAALAGTFGSDPVAVSTASAGSGDPGPSGGASVSGDNRVARYIAYHSFASNIVPGDTNGAQDVFVYKRQANKNIRASVSSSEHQANGASANPAVDGSVQRGPHCVAFQSQATNLAPGDRDRAWDVYVRDLRAGKTRLVSKGIGPSAVDPAISGDCRQIAFTAAGRIFIGNGFGKPRLAARGTNPDLALDGSALTWERGHGVWLKRRGRTTRVAAVGGNPRVSDSGAGQIWGVVFDTPQALVKGDHGSNSDVYLRDFKKSGGVKKTRLMSGRFGRTLGGDSHNGGITAYASIRGIIVFTTTTGSETTLWYANLHTGNIDDLAHAATSDGSPGIFDVASSARGNYIAFSSTETGFRGDRNGPTQDVFFKFLPQ
jgi:hypothetical protein